MTVLPITTEYIKLQDLMKLVSTNGGVLDGVQTSTFPTQGEAEAWFGESWEELGDQGVAAVTLRRDTLRWPIPPEVSARLVGEQIAAIRRRSERSSPFATAS